MAIILLGLTDCEEFYFNGSVHREAMSTVVQQDATTCSLLYFCKLLYTFQVVTPPIIRSTYNCNYSIWHWSNSLCHLPLLWCSWNAVLWLLANKQSQNLYGIMLYVQFSTPDD